MWCDEQDAKQLLLSLGIATPPGGLATSSAEAGRIAAGINGPVFVKGLTTDSSRASKGGVVRSTSPSQASAAFSAVTAALGVPTARVEAAVEVIAEFYLAAGFMDGGSLPEIALSAQGGSGIEERTDTLHRLSVDPLLGLRPFHIRRLLSEASVEENLRNAVISAVEACYELVAKHDVTLVEINPLGVTATGTVALDARCTLDDHAAYRHSHWRSLRCVRDYERSIEGMLALAGIAFVPLDGEIGVIGLGAGLTMHLADWLTNLGGRPAFFFDATAAAVRDHAPLFANEPARQFTDALQFGLGKVGHRVGVLLANFTSGGTPVNGLAEALLVALKDIGWKGELVLHVAGYRQAEAVSFLRSAGIEPAVSLGAAVRAALERGRSV